MWQHLLLTWILVKRYQERKRGIVQAGKIPYVA